MKTEIKTNHYCIQRSCGAISACEVQCNICSKSVKDRQIKTKHQIWIQPIINLAKP